MFAVIKTMIIQNKMLDDKINYPMLATLLPAFSNCISMLPVTKTMTFNMAL